MHRVAQKTIVHETTHFIDRRSAAPLLYGLWLCCEYKQYPIWFCAGTRAIREAVDITLTPTLALQHPPQPLREGATEYLQYSSQIVETGAICLEFSLNFLHSLLTPSFSLKFALVLTQCWATRILEQWDDCNTQINIGEGDNHTSVSRFVTSIVVMTMKVTL